MQSRLNAWSCPFLIQAVMLNAGPCAQMQGRMLNAGSYARTPSPPPEPPLRRPKFISFFPTPDHHFRSLSGGLLVEF